MVVHVVREKCKQCQKFFHPLELYLWKCHECWTARAAAFDKLTARQNFRECGECHSHVIAGYPAWDTLAKEWNFLCEKCYRKMNEKDAQIRGTPFAYKVKVQ